MWNHFVLMLVMCALAISGCAAGPATQPARAGQAVQPTQTAQAVQTMPAPIMTHSIKLDAKSATLRGVTLSTTRPSYTGSGFATGFTNRAGEIEWTFESDHAGIDDLIIRYSARGSKGYEMVLNSVGYDGSLPSSPNQFAEHNAGKVEIVKGQNVLKIGRGWGNYDIESVELKPSGAFAAPKPIVPKLVDAKATSQAHVLMKRLTETYGKGTLTGVIKDGDRSYVEANTQTTPLVMGGDLIEYSPSRIEHGSNPRNETERLIGDAKLGHIITLCWHWNAPKDLIDVKTFTTKAGKTVDASWYRGFYTEATTFDFAAAIDHPDSVEYGLLMRDIDTIAVELKKLDAANVPVLWRPLHESDGTWFWWGTKGPDHFKRLWRIVFDRLVNHHQLHNLIWVYTWENPDWYPGDDVVDIVGMDAYPKLAGDPLVSKWANALKHFDGNKLIALSEFGGTPDLVRMYKLGVRWAYFASWTGSNGPQKDKKDDLKRIYQSPEAINLKNAK